MREFCADCGGAPHPDEPGVVGTPGHLMKWGRLAPLQSPYEDVPVAEEPTKPDGPLWAKDGLPDGAPSTIGFLLERSKKVKIVESCGIWKGKEIHMLGITGICEEGVRYFSTWQKSPTSGKWTGVDRWLRDESGMRQVSWKEMKGVLSGLGGK